MALPFEIFGIFAIGIVVFSYAYSGFLKYKHRWEVQAATIISFHLISVFVVSLVYIPYLAYTQDITHQFTHYLEKYPSLFQVPGSIGLFVIIENWIGEHLTKWVESDGLPYVISFTLASLIAIASNAYLSLGDSAVLATVIGVVWFMDAFSDG